MHENDQAPTGEEHDETGPGPGELSAAGVGPQAADVPADELDGFAANDVAHLARLMPDTTVWSRIAASARLFNQVSASARMLDQLRAQTRMFDQVSASTRVFEQAAKAMSGWKSISMVSPQISQAMTAHQVLDKLRLGAAMPDLAWISAAVPRWKSWPIPGSIGHWRIPGWTVPSSLAMTSAESILPTFVLPQVWRFDLYDVLRRIRDQLDQADDYLGGLFFAALDARDAVLTDPDATKIVHRFARIWLKIRQVTRYVLDAVVDVLLSDDWHELDVTEDELREHLRARTREQHALHRPVFERQLGGYSIGSLSAQIHTDVGVLTLDQVVAGRHDTEREALRQQWADSRIGPLLDKLTPQQRHVVEVVAHDDLGWCEAAAVADVTPEEVEATRRRVRYLAAEQKRRAAAR
jgi:hypothetical protein